MKNFLSALLLTTMSLAATSSFAQTWTMTSAPSNDVTWNAIAFSANGKQLVALAGGKIYNSTDFNSFSTSSIPAFCTGVASSADGTKIVATTTVATYISTNSGATWNLTPPPGSPISGFVVSSADGSQFAGGSAVYISTNSGTTWNPKGGFPKEAYRAKLTSLAASADFNTLLVGFGSAVYVLKDASDRWSGWSNCLSTGYSFSYVTCSADGSRMAAAFGGHCATPGPIFTSADSGKTWTQTSAPILNWMAIASSANGKILVAASGPPTYTNLPNLILTSSDFGVTWTPNEVPAAGYEWSSVACSADGSVMAAGSLRGGLWISRQPVQPTLGSIVGATNCALSWIVPSAAFVLQRTSDLTADWVTVTTPPVLNLTNLQNEVFLQKPEQNAFYRLIAQ